MNKFNASNVLQFFRKYKYLILFIVILILIVLVPNPIREGLESMSIGEYDFLEPVPKDNIISRDLLDKFVKKWNSVHGCDNNKESNGGCFRNLPLPKDVIINLNSNYTDKEVQYYIQYGVWPYCGYLINYLNENKNAIQTKFDNKFPGLKIIQKSMTSRPVFDLVVNMTGTTQEISDGKGGHINLPSGSKLAIDIFNGKVKPPSSSNPLKNSSSQSSIENTNNVQNSYYQDFVSLCKKVTA